MAFRSKNEDAKYIKNMVILLKQIIIGGSNADCVVGINLILGISEEVFFVKITDSE